MPFWGMGVGHLFDRERLARRAVQALQTVANTAGDLKLTESLRQVVTANVEISDQLPDEGCLDNVETFNKKIASATAEVLRYLNEKWEAEKYKEPRSASKDSNDSPETYDDATKGAEDFVAIVYAGFIQVVLIRIRSLMICVCGMFVFIVGSLNVYPFEPRGALRTFTIFLLLVIIWVVGIVFTQVKRDATLSWITDTSPGELGGDFWLKLLQFGALPLLSLVAAQCPEVANLLFSWLEPATQALR